MSVKLRTKKTKDGGNSLYLDIYYKGKRKYEFLGLTIKKNDKNRSKIKEIAEKRRSQKELEIFANAYDLPNFYNGKSDLLKFYEGNCTDTAYTSSLNRLKKFAKTSLINGELPFSKVDEKFCENYKEYLIKEGLKNNSVWVFIYKLKAVLNKAVKEKIIPFNPARFVKARMEETEKIYLTVDELKKMYNTEYNDKEIRRAFLFSCFTGLRLSDIKSLTWQQIRENKVYFKQQKTRGIEYLPLSDSAIQILYKDVSQDRINNLSENVFQILIKRSEDIGSHLRKWAKLAGVQKYISFHTARHTFATLSLTYGIDLYTVSKMLGHKNINTTQVYAKIINEKVNEAVKKLPTF